MTYKDFFILSWILHQEPATLNQFLKEIRNQDIAIYLHQNSSTLIYLDRQNKTALTEENLPSQYHAQTLFVSIHPKAQQQIQASLKQQQHQKQVSPIPLYFLVKKQPDGENQQSLKQTKRR